MLTLDKYLLSENTGNIYFFKGLTIEKQEKV